MSHATISFALSTHLQALGLPTEFENQDDFTPPDGVYLSESFLPSSTTQPSLSHSGTVDYEGIYQVTVYAPRDKGKFSAYNTAEAVCAHFKRGTRLARDGVTVEINEPPTQARAVPVADRFAVPVSIDWRSLVRVVFP